MILNDVQTKGVLGQADDDPGSRLRSSTGSSTYWSSYAGTYVPYGSSARQGAAADAQSGGMWSNFGSFVGNLVGGIMRGSGVTDQPVGPPPSTIQAPGSGLGSSILPLGIAAAAVVGAIYLFKRSKRAAA